jgi:hypothetical protein
MSAVARSVPEQQFVWYQLTWDQYEGLLRALGDGPMITQDHLASGLPNSDASSVRHEHRLPSRHWPAQPGGMLTRSPITPADQAEAFFLLLTNRLSKTTGQIIPVDGGLHEVFLRLR